MISIIQIHVFKRPGLTGRIKKVTCLSFILWRLLINSLEDNLFWRCFYVVQLGWKVSKILLFLRRLFRPLNGLVVTLNALSSMNVLVAVRLTIWNTSYENAVCTSLQSLSVSMISSWNVSPLVPGSRLIIWLKVFYLDRDWPSSRLYQNLSYNV